VNSFFKEGSNAMKSKIRWSACFAVALLCLADYAFGAESFVQAFGGSSSDRFYDVVKTSDNGTALVGYTYSYGAGGKDVLLVKLDQCGNFLWARTLGGEASEEGRCIIQTNDGGLAVAGYTNSFGGGGDNLLVAKFSSSGSRLWSKVITDTDGDFEFYGYDMVEEFSTSHHLIVTGYMLNNTLNRDELVLFEFSSGGTLLDARRHYDAGLPQYEHRGYSLVQASNSDFVVVGDMYHPSYGREILLARFDSDLDVLWGWWIAGEETSGTAYSIIRTSDYGYAIAGEVGSDMFLALRNSDLNPVRQRRLSGSGTVGYSVAETYGDSLIVVGKNSSGSGGAILAMWDSDGYYEWTRGLFDPGVSSEGWSVVEDNNKNLRLAGYAGSGWGPGGSDGLIIQCDSSGTTCIPDQGGPSDASWNPDEAGHSLQQSSLMSYIQDYSWSVTPASPTPSKEVVCYWPGIDIYAPSSGGQLFGGTQYAVSWTPTLPQYSPNLKFRYSTNGGGGWSSEVTIANSGSYSWEVPCLTSADCLIELCTPDGCICDTSGQFSIVEPAVDISSPTMGQSLIGGTECTVRWDSFLPEYSPSLKFSCSTDGGGSWSSEVTIANSGSYSWEVPCLTSADCLIELHASDGCACDTSDHFSITEPAIYISSPAMGEALIGGTEYMVAWDCLPPEYSQDLEFRYSTNGGGSWSSEVTIPNSGSYLWQVPDITSADCLIELCTGGGCACGTSNCFSIVNPGENCHLLLIDHSGSMHANIRSTHNSRFVDAIATAINDVHTIIPDGSLIEVMYFDTYGIVLQQGYIDDTSAVTDALNSIPGPPGGLTNLADALCSSGDGLAVGGCANKTLHVYTDGYENASDCGISGICDSCGAYCNTGWNYACTPDVDCSDWQDCIAHTLTANAITMVRYFGQPITKGAAAGDQYDPRSMTETSYGGTPDMNWLQYIAEESGGEFTFIPDYTLLPGDADGSGIYTILDITYLINYVYKGGPAPVPDPIAAGDANCNGTVNLLDIVFLINYLLKNGPEPICPAGSR
jgi:hypothetical protein